jgi:hypothetical protein
MTYSIRRGSDGPSMTERVLDVMTAHPGQPMTTGEAAELAGITQKQAQNVLTRSRTLGRLGKVGRDRFVYPPSEGSSPVRPVRETPADLRPITDAIDDDVFKGVGLQPVGMAADGSRICVDDQGQAWKVRVTVEARMI